MDEAKGEQLRQQRPAWQTIHDAGGKVLVASCDDKGNQGSFRQMGDLQDLVVYSGPPLASTAARQKGQTQLADQAEKWLNAIDAEHADLDQLRQQMIDWILKLKNA